MKKNIIFSLITLLLISSLIKSQSLKLGFRFEPGLLITEKSNMIGVFPVFFCLYGETILEPTEWLGVEIRPGYLLAGNYSGFEIGAFTRVKILSTRFFLIAGLNNHSNDFSNAHNGGGAYFKQMLFKALGIGFQSNSKLSLDIIYYWTNDKDFEYSIRSDFLTYSKIVNTQMNGIIKVGFSLAWEVIRF